MYWDSAVASLRKTTREFQSELVITRAWNEGEQDLLEEEDEINEEERAFLIDPALNFTCFPTAKEDEYEDASVSGTTFTWWDFAGDQDDVFMFVCAPDATAKMTAIFTQVVYRCMFERQHNRSASEATEQDLAVYQVGSSMKAHDRPTSTPTPPTVIAQQPKQPLFRPDSKDDEPANVSYDDDDEISAQLTGAVGNLSIEQEDVPTPSARAAGKQRATEPEPAGIPSGQLNVEDVAATVTNPPDDRSLLLSETADLCLYDQATEMFMLQEKEVQANLWIVKGVEFPCELISGAGLKRFSLRSCVLAGWLTVAGNKGHLWVSTPVDTSMPLTFEEVSIAVCIVLDQAYFPRNSANYVSSSTSHTKTHPIRGF